MPQDILITPGSGEPQILFRGSGVQDTAINLNVLSSYQSASRSGTALVFEGTEGQLFAITDNLSSGTIFGVGDVTGLPLLRIDASGDVTLAEFGRFVGVGTGVPRFNLDVRGTGNFSTAIVSNNATFNGSVGVSQNTPGGKLHVNTLTSTNKGLIVQGAAAQSANLQEWQNSAGTVLASVDKDGDVTAATGTFTFLQLTSSIPRQSGLFFLDNNGILSTSTNFIHDRSNLASPRLLFKASGVATPDISLNVLTSASGSTSGVQTLSFEGSAGQLFSISDVLNSGTIFSVNDISGLPMLEVDATGLVSLARFGTGIVAHTPISLGGTTASFPSIRRSGITTQFRLADNSADSAISAGSGVFSANLISNPSISGVLSVNGQLMLERFSDTQLNFVYRGNDSTTRRVAVPLTNGALLNKAGDTLTGTINVTEIINTPTGVSQTINLGSGNHQTLNLGSAAGTVAVTLTVPSASAVGSLIVTQGATIRNVTWSTSSGSIIWMGGEPVWITDNSNSSRIMAWRWDGSNMRLAVSEMSA